MTKVKKGRRKTVLVRISDEAHQKGKEEAELGEISFAAWVDNVLRKWLNMKRDDES